MNERLKRYEPWLYAIAILVAVTFRVINLNSLPLDDVEASVALNAFHLATGSHPVSGDQPLYALITSFLFYVFGSSNFLARLLPVLAGCSLVLLPILIRDELGRLSAIILAFGLAIDPALVTLSRQAGSVMPAVGLSLATACFAWKNQKRLAAVFGGLALLAGTAFWFGLTGFILIIVGLKILQSRMAVSRIVDAETKAQVPWIFKWIKETWPVFVITVLLGGTFFVLNPSGLSTLVNSLLNYLKGWYTPGEISMLRILCAIVIYQTIPLLTGMIEGISGVIQRVAPRKEVLLAFLVFFAMTLLYPGRQMGDLAWSIVCLWVLSSWRLARLADTPREVVLPMLGHAALVITLSIFVILNISWVLGGFGGLDVSRALAVLGGVVVIVIISFLIAYGWGIAVAVRGALLGAGSILLVIMISLGISASGLNVKSVPDLWQPEARVTGAATLSNDLDEFSVWGTGVRESLSVTVVRFDMPSMHWFLRDYQKTVFVDTLAPAASPDVVITDYVFRPELSDSYRGETFAWYTTADWHSMNTLGMLDWIFHRKATENPVNLIFWVRQDLFVSGGQSIIQ